MQIFLNLYGENVVLPIAHRYQLQGMIYQGLREGNEHYSRYLHDQGKVYDDRQFKLFTFGPLMGQYEVQDKMICFDGSLGLEIRSIDTPFIQSLLYSFIPGSTVSLMGNPLLVMGCQLGDNTVFHRQIRIRMLSPIVSYWTEDDGYTRYFSPAEPEFYASVIKNAQRKWGSAGGDPSEFAFSISLAEGCIPKKQVTTFKNTRINGWFGEYLLEGTPQVLDLLYNTGLGSKNSHGFGMFEIR